MTDRRNNNFDVLRLLAAWLVLYGHSYPLSKQGITDPFARTVGIDTLGGIGVSIFFVLSGYLVTISWQRASSVSDFAWKRARRIFPALIACVLLCTFVLGPLLTTLPILGYLQNAQTWEYLVTATAYEIRFALPQVFDTLPSASIINGSLWSLPYEIHCYIALAAIGVLPITLRWKLCVIVLLLSLALWVRPLSPPADAFKSAFAMDLYANKLGLHFAVGALLASWRDSIGQRYSWLWVGALPFAACLLLDHSSFKVAVYVVTSSLVLIAAGLHAPWLPKLPESMGDWSYGLYLWAYPVQQLIVYVFGVGHLDLASYVILSTITAMVCAAASWFLVEKRFLSIRNAPTGWIRKRN